MAADLTAWRGTVAADGTLAIQAAVANSFYVASLANAATTYAEGIAGVVEKVAGDESVRRSKTPSQLADAAQPGNVFHR